MKVVFDGGRLFSATELRQRMSVIGLKSAYRAVVHESFSGELTGGINVIITHSPYGEGYGVGRQVRLEEIQFRLSSQPHTSHRWCNGALDTLDVDLPVVVYESMAYLFSEPRMIVKGEYVEIIRGKHQGKRGDVFWAGPSKFGVGGRLGVELGEGAQAWVGEGEVSLPSSWSTAPQWSALHDAVERQHIERLSDLICSGHPLDVPTNEQRDSARWPEPYPRGSTALHVAMWGTYEVEIRTLLEAGADPNIISDDGRTAGDIIGYGWGHAPSCNLAKVVPLLVEANAQMARGVRDAIERGNGVILVALAEAGYDFSRPYDDGQTVLSLLEQKGHIQWCSFDRVRALVESTMC